MGLALVQLGRTNEAKAAYTNAIRINPDSVAAYVNPGNLLNSEGHVQEAIAQYSEAIRINPQDSISHFNLGNAYRSLDRLDQALEQYQEALRLNPEIPDAHLQVGLNSHGKEMTRPPSPISEPPSNWIPNSTKPI